MFAEPQHKNIPQLLNPQSHYVQREMEVGGKDDPQEKEADAVADSVMRQSESTGLQDEEKVQPKVSRETVARLIQRSSDSQRAPVPRTPVMPLLRRKEKEDNIMRDHDAEENDMMRDHDAEAEKEDIMRTPESEMPVMRDDEERARPMRDEEESVKRSAAESTVGEKGGAAPPAVAQGIQASKGQGNALPENVQQDIGGKMGADLSDVRIHTGPQAHDMSTAIHAKAFTHGQDIYFKNGNYDPSSSGGKRLLTHELAHTQQQKGGVKRKVQRNWLWTRMKNYMKSQVKESMRSLPDWLQFYLSFQIGIVAGIADWVKDILVTLWNMSIFKYIYELIWGDLISDMKELGNAIKNMTWDQFKEILSEVKSQIVGDVKAFWARMTSDDPQTSGYAWGWIIGYLIPEVVLIVITDGIYAGAKWGAKLLQWLGRLGSKILQLGSRGVRIVQKGVVKSWKAVTKGVKKGWQGTRKWWNSSKKSKSKKFFGNLAKHPLRIKYEQEVAALKKLGDDMLLQGKSEEDVARILHQMRRDLGVKYKDATPADLRDYIYRMNKMDYGDELGPSVDYLRNVKGKSWQDIIASASKPGGRFNRQYLLDKFPNEHNKLIPILDKYDIK